MPKYEPLDVGVTILASRSDLLEFRWRSDGVTAYFAIPGDDQHALRIVFDGACIVRLLDELYLSTEDDPRDREGMVAGHFAYRVKGAPFAAAQSELLVDFDKDAAHYQFVTGWTCMDVLGGPPSFAVVEADEVRPTRAPPRVIIR